MNNFDELSKNVVKINTSKGSGSGFYIKDNDIIITNHHVVSGHRSVAIETTNKDKIKSNVIQVNPLLDIAFLKPSLPLSSININFNLQNKISNREKVFILGYPFGMPFTITEGIISSTKQLVNGQYYIQTDAAINPGNSGGPMINNAGEIIGITTCKLTQAENMGFALPSEKLIDELEIYKKNPSSDYSVKCPSCNYLIFEKTEYCENCGAKLDIEKFFDDITLSSLALFIEETLKKMDIDPVIARHGTEFWEFHKGSALIRIFIYKNSYLFTTCPMVKLTKTKINELYKYLLSNPVKPFNLGIYLQNVFLSYRIHLSDIDSIYKENIRNNIINLANKADELDNYLVDNYECEWSDEAKPD